MIGHLFLAISTFIVTNIDDLLILTFYFASRRIKTGLIVFGQILGIAILVSVSLIGVLVDKFLADHWISLLGLFPIYLGVRELKSKQDDDELEMNEKPAQRAFPMLQVAAVTIANGGDNIGVYAPMFAKTTAHLIPVYVLAYLLLTLAWCALAMYLVRHPYLKNVIHQYGKKVFPYFLILLGVFILYDFLKYIIKG